jgi:hypothetical protein
MDAVSGLRVPSPTRHPDPASPHHDACHGPLGWNDALVVGRWVGLALGTANIALVAVLAARWRGWVAGVVVAMLYATFGPAVAIERHILLEPAVNAAVLWAAMLWLPSTGRVSTRRAAGTGALVGLAAAIKLTGGLAIVGVVLADRFRAQWRERAVAVGVTVAVFGLIVVPFVASAGPGEFVRQVVGVQTGRPGGDVVGGSVMGLRPRLRELTLFGVMNVANVPGVARLVVLVAVIAAVVWAWTLGGRHGRFWASVSIAMGLAVLLAPDYYVQYSVAVAPSLAIALGAGAVASLETLQRYGRAPLRLATVALAIVLVAGMVAVIRSQLISLPRGAPDVGALIRAQLDPGDCVSSDAPYLVIAAGMLPHPDATGAPLVDPFGEMLTIALERTRAWPSTSAALLDESAQERLRAALAGCKYVALTSLPENNVRFSGTTARWFTEHHAILLDGGGRPTLWVRLDHVA